MRLKSLELKGFKSFANDTLIHFDEDVIGIVGAGIMGTDIAHIAADSGFRVMLYDIDELKSKNAFENIKSRLSRYSCPVDRSLASDQWDYWCHRRNSHDLQG